MQITAMMAIAAVMAAGTQAQDRDAMSDILNDPDVVSAMRTAWQEAMNGAARIEATFRLDGSPSDYTVIAAPATQQHRKQTVQIVVGATFAVFHVHTVRAEPEPSPQDRRIADTYKLRMYTMHHHGLYEYDPATRKTTLLRIGLDWLKLARLAEESRNHAGACDPRSQEAAWKTRSRVGALRNPGALEVRLKGQGRSG
jgi:hypothetical protein